MTGTGAESLAEMLDERQHLLEIAVWMFGSAATADRIVQETYRRWYALDDAERSGITTPRAWLTRVAGGICLELLAAPIALPTDAPEPDMLTAPPTGGPVTGRLSEPTSGRLSEPTTVGLPEPTTGWLSEPIINRLSEPGTGGLWGLSGQGWSRRAMLDRHDRVVRRLAVACDTGDVAALKTVLAADAMVVSDGGGKLRVPVRPIYGADAVARFVTALLTGQPGTDVAVGSVNGRAGLVLRRSGQAVAVVSVSVAETGVTAVWITLNPDKLRRWHRS
jgi:RNA polymerase sigma-70 factor (ECF subfamily)